MLQSLMGILKAGKNKPNIWIEAGFKYIVNKDMFKINMYLYITQLATNEDLSFRTPFVRTAYLLKNSFAFITFDITGIVQYTLFFVRYTWKRMDFSRCGYIYNQRVSERQQ